MTSFRITLSANIAFVDGIGMLRHLHLSEKGLMKAFVGWKLEVFTSVCNFERRLI